MLSSILIFTKKYRKLGITMLLALALGFFIGNIILKPLVGRIRPYDINTNIVMLVKSLRDYSFPSGHTLGAFEVATVLTCHNKRLGKYAFTIASLIGFSRLYLYVHFPTDVLVGAILGTVFGVISHIIVNYFYERRSNKNNFI